MPNPMVHWEINTDDAGQAQQFYAGLFGWSVDANNPVNYGLAQSETWRGADGGIHHDDSVSKGFMIYVEVDDLPAFLDKAVSLGGSVVTPVTDIPGIVTLARFADPQGNLVGLVKSEDQPAG